MIHAQWLNYALRDKWHSGSRIKQGTSFDRCAIWGYDFNLAGHEKGIWNIWSSWGIGRHLLQIVSWHRSDCLGMGSWTSECCGFLQVIVDQRMMRLLTFSASIRAWAVFGKVTWFQVIDTQLVVDSRHHLVSRHGLELGTNISPLQKTQVLVTPAVNVADCGWKFFIEASLWFGFEFCSGSKHSDAWTLRLINSMNLYPETFSEYWSCLCHSKSVVGSNFSCRKEVMNGPSGLLPGAFRARMCCWGVSWSRQSSLPLPSLREGMSTISFWRELGEWAWASCSELSDT